LKQIEAAGTHPPRYATVQRWHLLRLGDGRALLLFGVRIGRQHEHRGHGRRSDDAHQVAHAHVRLSQSSSAARFTAGASGFFNLSQSVGILSGFNEEEFKNIL
jgi:hypothetical protein